jgi:hypothetical protein
MIFPQGGFCKAALRALSAEGYLAAINTSVMASDAAPRELTYRALLDVAPITYADCPLFSRRYTDRLFPVAFDLFMGKPALIVQHHGDFRDGYEAAGGFVRALTKQDGAVTWSSAAQAVQHAALWKEIGPQEQWIRFYTREFRFRNPTANPTTYRLFKKLALGTAAQGVERDGRPLDFAVENSVLTTELRLDPGETAHVATPLPAYSDGPGEFRGGPLYRTRVASRRWLSEFRDNYVSRSRWLLTKAEGFKTSWQRRN